MTFDQSTQHRLTRAIATERTRGATKLLADPWRQTRSRLLEFACRRRRTVWHRSATTFWGEHIEVVYPECVSVAIDRYGFFEAEVTACLIDRLRPGMTFFDVGAHFGFFAMLAAKLVGPTGSVHVFEPTPSTFEILKRNLGGRPNVTLINAAAFSSDTTLEFRDYGVARSAYNSLGVGKLDPTELKRGAAEPAIVQVRAIAIDSYLAATGARPDLLKIDTEGAELEVLRGMEGLLSKVSATRPALTLEVGDIGAPPGTSPSRRVVDSMLARGYRGLEFRDDKWLPHTVRDKYSYTNLLFEP